jgi:GNAT superfamily N-acetyltransferase
MLSPDVSRPKEDEMMEKHFNYRANFVDGWWGRRSFIQNWWRIYAADPHWAPPHAPTLSRMVEPARNPHLGRLSPMPLYVDALPRRHSGQVRTTAGTGMVGMTPVLFEVPVAAVMALQDPRRQDGAAYLGLLHCANDAGSLERLLGFLAEELAPLGVRRLIGPTGLSPHVGSGVLQDDFHRDPPLHTPYNPPYLPELMQAIFRPAARSQLYSLDVPAAGPSHAGGPAEIVPLDVRRLAADLLPLMQAACPTWAGFVPPDGPEAVFLLRWLGQWPLQGWLAQVAGEPAGFILLQADLAAQVRRAQGGRNPLWRLWMAWRASRPVHAGRLLLGAVMPQWQGQGIGGQLWQHTLSVARQCGWRRLTAGPLPSSAGPALRFLQKRGARAGANYLLYGFDL